MFNLHSKKHITRANAFATLGVVVLIAVVLNIFSSQFFGRWDATENKEYSISDAAKNMLSNLDDVINVKAYFTTDVPGYLLQRNQEVKDMLSEFETVSSGTVLVTYLDPSNPDIETEARGIGIPTLQFNVVEKDAYQVRNGYLGIALFYGDDQEIIPLVQDTATLEYDMMAAISKLTRNELPVVGFIAGKGAFSRSAEMTAVNNELERQYAVRDIDITTGNLIPSDINTLIVPGITELLTDREKYVLDQFVASGGSMLVLAEGVTLRPEDLSAEKSTTGLGELLAHWGVRLNQNLVYDTSNELAGFRTDQTQFFTPYPLWVKVATDGFNPDANSVNKLESAIFTWASTLDILDEKLGDTTQHTDLIRTTAHSWTQDDAWQLNPQVITQPSPDMVGSRVLATMLTGTFKSIYTRSTIPPKDTSAVDGTIVKGRVTQDDRDAFVEGTDSGRVIVVADSEFALDVNIRRYEGNAVLFLNLVDSLTSDESLTTIRSKAITDRPLAQLTESKKNLLKWGNVLGVSGLFAVYGLMRFMRRRRSKK